MPPRLQIQRGYYSKIDGWTSSILLTTIRSIEKEKNRAFITGGFSLFVSENKAWFRFLIAKRLKTWFTERNKFDESLFIHSIHLSLMFSVSLLLISQSEKNSIVGHLIIGHPSQNQHFDVRVFLLSRSASPAFLQAWVARSALVPFPSSSVLRPNSNFGILIS